MKTENLREIFLVQDISVCKKMEMTAVKHSIHIYCRKTSNYIEGAQFVLNCSDVIVWLIINSLLSRASSASLFNQCETEGLYSSIGK